MDDTYHQKHLSIKSWAEDDRPREKMLQKGRSALSDAELLAILVGSGSKNESAVDLCKRVLQAYGNDLKRLGEVGIKELTHFKGIGEAKAISILAALEIGRRRAGSKSQKRVAIGSSKDAFDALYPHLSDLDHEEFFALLLNRSNKIIEAVRISQGGVTGTVADSKIIFKMAIDKLACGVIVGHNHPSGNLRPSDADIRLTKTLKEAGKLLDVQVLDHLIIADHSYFSFADEGLL